MTSRLNGALRSRRTAPEQTQRLFVSISLEFHTSGLYSRIKKVNYAICRTLLIPP